MKILSTSLLLIVVATRYVHGSGGYDSSCSDEVECYKNEVYTKCGPSIEYQDTCEYPDNSHDCPDDCVPGCVCRKGYIRDSKGRCIPKDQCYEPKCPKYEEYQKCGWLQKCVPTCDEPFLKPCPKVCNSGCYCIEGYIRDSNGNCIPEDKCPKKCKKHEVFTNCGPPLPCQGTCLKPNGIPCRAKCQPLCICKKGYVRDAKGNCIPLNKCPNTCKKNEIWAKCSGFCFEKRCEDLLHPVACRPTFPCTPGCICKDGFYRNKDGKCVAAEQCPETQCHKKHEEYSDCGSPSYCELSCDGPPAGTVCPLKCVPGCFCKNGYVRDSKRNCILKEDCPQKCEKKHQVYKKCGPHHTCIPSCDNPNPIGCPKICVAGCFCKDGYVLDCNGDCIPVENCPKPTCSKKHEVYKDCGPIEGCEVSCDRPAGSFSCTKNCRAGCFCDKGYVRDSKGNCIREEDCPNKCEKKHQVYKKYGPHHTCVPTCDNPYPVCVLKIYVPGCYCKDGYVLDCNGDCIPIENCPKPTCSKKHEEYSDCGSPDYCELSCDGPPAGTVCPLKCVPGCFCKNGYVRDSKRNCILKEDCPQKSCPSTEMWVDCSGFCFEKRCSDLLHPVVCKPGKCVPGCVCKEGYYRNKIGKCVKANQCPEANECGKHEFFDECGWLQRCVPTCDEPFLKPCPKICATGCYCKDGYIRDKLNGKCIPEDHCPKKKCKKPYQVWSECGANGCQNTCEDPTFSHRCKGPCIAGCVCEEGYLRDGDECVHSSNC